MVDKVEMFIGHNCSKCGLVVGVYTSVGAEGACPRCNGNLQAKHQFLKTRVIANFCCSVCGSKAGMINVVGGDARCPSCKNPIPEE